MGAEKHSAQKVQTQSHHADLPFGVVLGSAFVLPPASAEELVETADVALTDSQIHFDQHSVVQVAFLGCFAAAAAAAVGIACLALSSC